MSRYIPTELRTVLGRLSTDWTLGMSLEDVHQMLELYLPTIEFEFLDEYVLFLCQPNRLLY